MKIEARPGGEVTVSEDALRPTTLAIGRAKGADLTRALGVGYAVVGDALGSPTSSNELALHFRMRFAERWLSNGSINHTLRHLAQILETAVEYELIPSNPATGRRRRPKATKPARPWVEPEQLMAFLDKAPNRVGQVLLAILAGAGLRIGEALAVRWRDVDLGTGTLYVRDSKTLKGVREVHLTPALRETLVLWKADANYTSADAYVIHTSTGRKQNP